MNKNSLASFAICSITGMGLCGFVEPISASALLYNYSVDFSVESLGPYDSDYEYVSLSSPADYGDYSSSSYIGGEVYGSLFLAEADAFLRIGQEAISARVFADGWGFERPEARAELSTTFTVAQASVWSLSATALKSGDDWSQNITLMKSGLESIYIGNDWKIDDSFLVTLDPGSYNLHMFAGNNYETSQGIPARASFDLNFIELVPISVPIPAALPMFLSGLIGLGFLARRHKLGC